MSYDSISPIDGRYAAEAKPLSAFFSERALAEERLKVELAYLRLLVELGVAPRSDVPELALSATRLKSIEREVGHDVKAVELFVREALKKRGRPELSPYVHLGLTSEDTNSVAFGRLLASALGQVVVPAYRHLATDLAGIAQREAGTSMLARTHGRPAVPTTFGKEVAVFALRFAERTARLSGLRPVAKISGAAGTYASFELISKRDWLSTFREFTSDMGLDYAEYTTQVAPGERLSDILHLVVNVNQLMISLCRDLWLYQTLDYLHFERPVSKVSSSTMPQKVNPVDLENAEGQAEVSNSILGMIAYRLQLTRLQRDLSDSVIRRMVGQGLSHSLVSCERLRHSLRTMVVERSRMADDLRAHPEVYAEALQIALKLGGDERGYEKVKSRLSKGGRLARPTELGRAGRYLGLAPDLASRCKREVSEILSGGRL